MRFLNHTYASKHHAYMLMVGTGKAEVNESPAIAQLQIRKTGLTISTGSAGEVSGDYYYAAGYGSTATASSNQAIGKSVTSNVAAQSQTTQGEATQAAMGMPSFANYQGATLEAAAQGEFYQIHIVCA